MVGLVEYDTGTRITQDVFVLVQDEISGLSKIQYCFYFHWNK